MHLREKSKQKAKRMNSFLSCLHSLNLQTSVASDYVQETLKRICFIQPFYSTNKETNDIE